MPSESRNTYPELCGKDECTACGACVTSCPREALAMEADKNGFSYPVINTSDCIGCLKCEKACPAKHKEGRRNGKPRIVVSGWIKDEKSRQSSSSGGAFSAIAEYTIEKGGCVCGAAYDENLKLTYQIVEKKEELQRLMGSKYVQAEVGTIFKEIKKQLETGRKVLFCGTPCHVRGLYATVGNKANLLTIDFICHGVPSPLTFEKYICWLKEKKNTAISNYNFRDKRFGTSYNIATSYDDGRTNNHILTGESNSYCIAYNRNIMLRESCYNCSSNGMERDSDFTLGDYRDKDYTIAEEAKGVSTIICNSDRAKELLPTLNLEYRDDDIEKVIIKNPNYTKRTPKPSEETRNGFFAKLQNETYEAAMKEYAKPTLSHRIKTAIMLTLGPKFFCILKHIK